MVRLLPLLILLCVPWGAAADPALNRIEISIESLRNDSGQVLCALHDSKAAFPRDSSKAVQKAQATVLDRRAVCVFNDVRPGTYAVGIVHDENSNGKLDTNFVGLPREGLGSSRDAKGFMGPPKFDDASFVYSGSVLKLTVHAIYLL